MELKPRYEEGCAMLLAGVRQNHAYADSMRSIPDRWQQFQRVGQIPGQIGSTTYGVVCANNPEREMFEYMCGVEVTDFEHLPVELGRMRIPKQRYAVFIHDGHVSKLKETWDAIWSGWLPESGHQTANTPDFEVYDERFDPKTGLGVIEIWFPIHP